MAVFAKKKSSTGELKLLQADDFYIIVVFGFIKLLHTPNFRRF